LLWLRVGRETLSHTIELGVSAPEATPVPVRLRVDPGAPGAKTITPATPTSVNAARKRWMMRTGSPLTQLLGQLTFGYSWMPLKAPNPLPIRWI
jgi:hypothetical protein